MFGHEKFGPYNAAIEFIGICANIISDLPHGNAYLVDQLKRASMSIALNIAEGSGKTSSRDKAKYYAVARGSAMECAAILDVLVQLQLIPKDRATKPRELLSKVAAILSKVCFSSK